MNGRTMKKSLTRHAATVAILALFLLLALGSAAAP